MLHLVFINKVPPQDAEPEDLRVSYPIVGDENLELKIIKKVSDFLDFDQFDFFINADKATEEEKILLKSLKGFTIKY